MSYDSNSQVFSRFATSSCSVYVSRFVTLSTLCVGTGTGGSTNMLACVPTELVFHPSTDWTVFRRVTITDFQGQTLMDTYVHPTMPVVDYRTASTGIDANAFNASMFVAHPVRIGKGSSVFSRFRVPFLKSSTLCCRSKLHYLALGVYVIRCS
jgi:hypothetical protein